VVCDKLRRFDSNMSAEMEKKADSIADSLKTLRQHGSPVEVTLSHDLIHLLSNQLYNSPVKAVEELVVNSFDAEATVCCVYVPATSDVDSKTVIVFDNGSGMSHSGLDDLWLIGHSPKGRDIADRLSRKHIGKFGIGKLAARTIADRLTYITKQNNGVLGLSMDFKKFDTPLDPPKTQSKKAPESEKPEENQIRAIETEVYEIADIPRFVNDTALGPVLQKCITGGAFDELSRLAGLSNKAELAEVLDKLPSWTVAILEELTPKARTIRQSTLTWVLSTAMPLVTDFSLYNNGKAVDSSKSEYERVVEFSVGELPDPRIKNLSKNTGVEWKIEEGHLVSAAFPSGISGNIVVTRETISGAKSDDLSRSHGFFVRVRQRLIDYKDALFGLKEQPYGTFNRFIADINADDLDQDLKASRDAFEETDNLHKFREVLRELFNEASARYEKWQKERPTSPSNKEGQRNQVQPTLVEFPIADVLTRSAEALKGPEADDTWFYLDLPGDGDVATLLKSLYEPTRSKKYSYEYVEAGETERMVKFDPSTARFRVNRKHELIKEYLNSSRGLVEDVVTAEALLEVYLRQSGVPISTVHTVLEQRDQLFRSLAKDRSYSLEMIADRLRDSASNEHELEISLVVAARALGFNAKHISGSGTPDGVASLDSYRKGRKRITLEAKSSQGTPGLGAIDFAGLDEHVSDEEGFEEIYFKEIDDLGEDYKGEGKFDGCLLVAPKYPGQTLGVNAVAKRAKLQKISCWTVDQLARVVEVAEIKKINAEKILDIVLHQYAPSDVAIAIDKMLEDPEWDYPDLYRSIFKVLRAQKFLSNINPTTVTGILTALAMLPEPERLNFRTLQVQHVQAAIVDLAAASQNGMQIENGENIFLTTDLDELERRLSDLLKGSVRPRRLSSFRQE